MSADPAAAACARDGLLLLDKPAGPTSHDVVATVRRSLRIRRVGHAGTLDPFATGLLVLCLGRATRLARFVSGGPKEYEGAIRLGLVTDTDDVTGRAIGERSGLVPDLAEIRDAAARLVGTHDQRPPDYSAKKVSGTPAYRRARRGEAVRLAHARVTVHSLEISGRDGAGDLAFRARVSPGTYLRALARDLGELLGTGACLAALRRTGSGPFSVADAVPPGAGPEALAAATVPIDSVPLGLPDLVVGPGEAERLASGGDLPWPAGARSDGPFRLLDDAGRLLAIGRAAEGAGGDRLLHPEIVLRPASSPPGSFTRQEDM